MPPVAIVGAGLAVGGIVGAAIASSNEADAEQNIANAKLNEAARTRQVATGYAAPTAAELLEQKKMIAYQDSMLTRQERLLAAVDPALMEAGKQALQLLQGKQAAAVSPILKQRQQQRDELLQQLTDQMGPGAATSTAGANALNKFDTQTSLLTSQAQQDTLGKLLGVSQNTAANSYAGSAGLAGFSTILGNLGDIQKRQVNAALGTDITKYAGAPYVGDVVRASSMGNTFGSISDLGTQVATLGLKYNKSNIENKEQLKGTSGVDYEQPADINYARV